MQHVHIFLCFYRLFTKICKKESSFMIHMVAVLSVRYVMKSGISEISLYHLKLFILYLGSSLVF